MATAVALALDWAGEWMDPEVEQLAREAIVELALEPGTLLSPNNWWVDAYHNWNLVCHGGLVLAALVVYDEVPELATMLEVRNLLKDLKAKVISNRDFRLQLESVLKDKDKMEAVMSQLDQIAPLGDSEKEGEGE